MSAIGVFVIGISIFNGGSNAPATENQREIKIISHRGASGYAPEHTILSYQMGENMHGDFIEIDLQMTRDGKLIAMHDETVDRTTSGEGAVKDFTLQQIRELDAGGWFNKKYPQYAKPEYAGAKVPTLEEVFQKFGKKNSYYIETKSHELYPGMENELLRLIKKYDINKDRLLVQSFNPLSLLTIHEIDRSIKLVQLLTYKTEAMITDAEMKAIKRYAAGIGLNHLYLNKEYVQRVINNGLEIYTYTVNDKETMKTLIDWGITGIFTDFPDLMYEVKKDIEERSK